MKIKQWLCQHSFRIFIDYTSRPMPTDGVEEREGLIWCRDCGKKFRCLTAILNPAINNPPKRRSIKMAEYVSRPCKKKTYPDKKTAQTVFNHCLKQKRSIRPVRIYECHRCGGWHLTHKPNINDL